MSLSRKTAFNYIDGWLSSGLNVPLLSLTNNGFSEGEAKAALYAYRQVFPQNCLAKSTARVLYPSRRGFGKPNKRTAGQLVRSTQESYAFQGIKLDAKTLEVICGIS